MRLKLMTRAIIAVALSVASTSARAETYPSRKITIIVSFAPGGFVDSISRILANKLSDRFGQTVVVENRAGAGGNIAHRFVARGPADGYTILAASTSVAINASLYANPGYAPDELKPIAIFSGSPEIIVGNQNGPKTLSEVVQKASQTPLSFASAGFGSASSIVVSYFFKNMAKVPVAHVPFQGGAPGISAVLGSHVDLMGAAMAGGIVPFLQSGQLRGLAIAGHKRVAAAPDVPTYEEAGYKGLYATSWAGFFVPEKTPAEVSDVLNSAINSIMKEEDVLKIIEPQGFEAIYGSPAEADAMYRKDIENWKTMIDAVGMRIE